MSIILIGEAESLRTEYFSKAAKELNTNVTFVSFSDILNGTYSLGSLKNRVVKIDPPEYKSCDISEINILVTNYMELVKKVSQVPDILLLNSESSISTAINKAECMRILRLNNVSTTQILVLSSQKSPMTSEDLRDLMKEKRVHSVFLKPIMGSGAAGVAAFRINPKTGQKCLYSSAALNDNNLINTSKIVRYEDRENINRIIEGIFNLGAVVEKWIPKAVYNNKCYDLRVVFQFGKLDFIIARQSETPITNLHLNNDSLDYRELKLPDEKITEIEELCKKAVFCFNGLNTAGIDILLSKDSLKPYIIEINAQGDLIYKDIFVDNIIYKNQIKQMRKWIT